MRTLGVSRLKAGLAAGLTAVVLSSTFTIDHTHPNGLIGGGRLIEVIVEQEGKFYEVWGLTCKCGYIHVDDCALAGGVRPSIGPATGWTNEDVTKMYQGSDASDNRPYILDIRGAKYRT